ncbi:hypothetical protein TCAL_03992 [Tigriopus californicus]|uniref:ADP-ribosylglycohydrolase n=1 Tax=Tigriopus californicus TaxID=6832 RepID=A0A553NEN5_TIGCA|nr:crystallin J1A-like [Tigriopus californicus]TRY63868.1 hypothetical protein TCAL_03992 [Tigriopus californicus]|eukprot:TCALIF_03992-PA protein Name:"Similar to Crystallin J1A (Tripedalia cystophora)" AED:0.33 eAED:0.36 QI:0/-1/0/1/-1/1/1/0/343
MSSKFLPLLESAQSLTPAQQRGVAAILGACVADAAARPLHWVYSQSDLKTYIQDRADRPDFLPQSRSPFYTLPTGENSCYFDIAHSVLGALGGGEYDYDRICQRFLSDFGPGTRYDMAKREEYMQLRREGRIDGPIEGKWMHGALIKFMENRKAGRRPYGNDHIKETDGFCAALPVVAKFAGQASLKARVDEVIQTLSSWPTAVSHGHVAARIVEQFILGHENAIQEVRAQVKDEYPDVYRSLGVVEDKLGLDHVQAVQTVFGSPCYNPGSFQGALHAFQREESFPEAVRSTIRAGGCNCSRSLFIGACAGAKHGLDAIPMEWLEKTTDAETVFKQALAAFGK